MALGPIGNTIYVNQQTASVSNVQNAHNNRVEFQNVVAQISANEQKEEIKEIRPTEDNKELNPDREHQRQDADEETKRSKKRDNTSEDEDEDLDVHKLDIKV